MKINICESLLRRSVDNQIQTYRHNQREDEKLEKKFALYQRQLRSIDNSIYMTERRFEQHARDDLGFVVSHRRKPLEASKDHQFYYTSTNKHWTTTEYIVQPLQNVRQHQNLYEHAFERRSRQYSEELKQKACVYKLRKEQFMHQTLPLIRDDDDRTNDWTLLERARLKLPLISQSKSNSSPKICFSIEM